MPLDDVSWVAALTDEPSSGENLDATVEYANFEQAIQGKPEKQYGDTIVAAEDPDWREVETLARDLLARTHDLRVLTPLAVARLNLAGINGFAEALGAMRALLDAQWDGIHPQLDPEDDNDPMPRANAILGIGHPARVLKRLREMPLAVSPRGRLSWRDIAIATGAIEVETGEKLPESAIVAAFQDTDPSFLAGVAAAVAQAISDVKAIDATFDDKAGSGTGPDLDALAKLLADLGRTLKRYTPAVETAAEEAVEEAPQAAAAAPAASATGARAMALTAVASRSEALHLLDIVCHYYEHNEPSSPLPLLIARARRLADKSFLEVLEDLAPNGVDQARSIAGVQE